MSKRYVSFVSVYVVSWLIFANCAAQSSRGFELAGEIKNARDSTSVILYLFGDSTSVDSTVVIGGRFFFRGVVDRPTYSRLYVEGLRDGKTIWIENAPMRYYAEEGKNRDARVTGSLAQIDQDSLEAAIRPIQKEENSIDSLRAIETDAKKKSDLREKYLDTYRRENEAAVNFIRNHPQSMVSLNLLSGAKTSWGRDKVKELFGVLSDRLKLTVEGKQIEKYVDMNVNPKVGDHFVDFELPDVSGKPVRLSDVKGKLVLLDFWASWCGPCREENKELVKTYAMYHPGGFEILGISGDENRDNWLKAIKDDRLVWENVSDLKGSDCLPFLIYGINSIPDNFLIDESGRIIGRNLRGEDLRKTVESLLDGKSKK